MQKHRVTYTFQTLSIKINVSLKLFTVYTNLEIEIMQINYTNDAAHEESHVIDKERKRKNYGILSG